MDIEASSPKAPALQFDFARLPIIPPPFQRHEGFPTPFVSEAVHDTLRSSGRPLAAATRRLLEPAFGRSFADVRIHDDAQADVSARAVSAMAYTVGHHIAFRAGVFTPGTTAGIRLLAHELIHVVQQGDDARVRPSSSIEVGRADNPAERAANDVAELIEGLVISELGDAPPTAKRGLSKPRVGFDSDRVPPTHFPTVRPRSGHAGALLQRSVHVQAHNNLAIYFHNPEPNVDRIVDWLRELGSDAPETIRSIGYVRQPQYLRELAGTSGGRRILDWLGERWRRYGNETEQRLLAVQVQGILAQVGRPGAVGPGEQSAISILNAAFASDPHRAEYTRDAANVRGSTILLVPLRLPVVPKPPVPRDGGVYWDPSVPAEGGTIASLRLAYLAFGWRALEQSPGQPRSVESLQSIFWHEYQHYVQWFELRRQDRPHELRNAVLTGEFRRGAGNTNAEIEATSFQLSDALVRVRDDGEVDGVLGYLALHFGHALADPRFRDEAVARVLAPIRSDRMALNRLIRLIASRSDEERAALGPLLTAAQTALAALPPPPPVRRRP